MTEEKLRELVPKCHTARQVLSLMEMQASGGNYSTFKKYCKEFQIDISHFDGRAVKSIRKPAPKLLLSEILVNGRHMSSGHLKSRLFKAGLLENKCHICQIDQWQDRPLNCQIDHINGDTWDNRLENLRILCPNCHSQTETFSGRNIKRTEKTVRLCSVSGCSRQITKKNQSGICHKCITTKGTYPDHEVLKTWIKTKSFTEIGRIIGVTDNAVRKWCLRHGISIKP